MYTALYVTVYHGELIDSAGTPAAPRNFTVDMPGSTTTVNTEGVFLASGGWDFWPDAVSVSSASTVTLTRVPGSLAGPILNAMEVFARTEPRANKTYDRDGEFHV